MKTFKLKDFTRGWFVGNFEPSVLKTADFELCIKEYQAGDAENAHVHKIAQEITAVVSGKFKMNNQILMAGDIIQLLPNEPGEFECLEAGATVVVKTPSVIGDKYLV